MNVIPKQSDPALNAANMAAIDAAVGPTKYRYVVAWGKFLGFTPEKVLSEVRLAEAEMAGLAVIQKVGGRWLTTDDISSPANWKLVRDLAGEFSA